MEERLEQLRAQARELLERVQAGLVNNNVPIEDLKNFARELITLCNLSNLSEQLESCQTLDALDEFSDSLRDAIIRNPEVDPAIQELQNAARWFQKLVVTTRTLNEILPSVPREDRDRSRPMSGSADFRFDSDAGAGAPGRSLLEVIGALLGGINPPWGP